jgi:hypothetical protein
MNDIPFPYTHTHTHTHTQMYQMNENTVKHNQFIVKQYFVYNTLHGSAPTGHYQAIYFYIYIKPDDGPFELKHVACSKQNVTVKNTRKRMGTLAST